MTKEIRQYIAEIEKLLTDSSLTTDWRRVSSEMLVRISFYQHERLIHLIVTISFAVMTIISFYAAFNSELFLLLAGLFLILDIPYIIHYYFLENSVQKLYKHYHSVKDRSDGQNEYPSSE